MIRTEREYQKALKKLDEEKVIIESQIKELKDMGLDGAELERALQPTISFNEQLKEEVQFYECVRRGELGTLRTLNNIGRWLIGARIAKGWSQKDLAEKLLISEAQVSRDEKNEYHGIKVERAQRILETMGFQFKMEEEVELGSFLQSDSYVEDGNNVMPPPIVDIPQQVTAFLRGDPNLNPEKADNLAKIFDLAYKSIAESDKEK